MSPVRFLENTTLPAPIIATLITNDSCQTEKQLKHESTRISTNAHEGNGDSSLIPFVKIRADSCRFVFQFPFQPRRIHYAASSDGLHPETASEHGQIRGDQA